MFRVIAFHSTTLPLKTKKSPAPVKITATFLTFIARSFVYVVLTMSRTRNKPVQARQNFPPPEEAPALYSREQAPVILTIAGDAIETLCTP